MRRTVMLTQADSGTPAWPSRIQMTAPTCDIPQHIRAAFAERPFMCLSRRVRARADADRRPLSNYISLVKHVEERQEKAQA